MYSRKTTYRNVNSCAIKKFFVGINKNYRKMAYTAHVSEYHVIELERICWRLQDAASCRNESVVGTMLCNFVFVYKISIGDRWHDTWSFQIWSNVESKYFSLAQSFLRNAGKMWKILNVTGRLSTFITEIMVNTAAIII